MGTLDGIQATALILILFYPRLIPSLLWTLVFTSPHNKEVVFSNL